MNWMDARSAGSLFPRKELNDLGLDLHEDGYSDPVAFVLRVEDRVRALLIAELLPVFEAAAKADPQLVAYHSGRLKADLVPLRLRGR